MDISPVRVSGGVTAQRGRAIWRNGRLYIFTSFTDATVFDAPDRPTKTGAKTWQSNGVTMQMNGCKCGCAHCKVTAQRLIRPVDEAIASGELEVQGG